MGDLPRKNGWTITEHAGDATPYRMQRLGNHAVWDTDAAMAVVQGFVVEHLAGELAVGALDESGQQKQGGGTAGVFMILIARAPATVWKVNRSPRGHRGWVVGQT